METTAGCVLLAQLAPIVDLSSVAINSHGFKLREGLHAGLDAVGLPIVEVVAVEVAHVLRSFLRTDAFIDLIVLL